MSTVFFSYSHKDESLRDRLETSLSAMKRQGLIDTWHDRRITAGEKLGDRISAELERADVILLLVSPDFIDSDYCYEQEMKRALERHAAAEALVIPVILRPCDWHHLPFGSILAAPTDGKPVTKWPDQDDAFLDVTTAIRKALVARGSPAKAAVAGAPPPAAPPTAAAPPAPGPRSSNLSVRKQLTDADRDRFLDETFEFVARFFETSLEELKARNDDIDTNYRRIDSDTFTANIYRGGASASKCKIVRGGMFGQGISYSMDTTGHAHSINDSLTIGNDAHGFFMKALNMGMRGGATGDKSLTPEGAAEYYWGILIEPLQRRR